ncbi:MAG TPA: hypothetical protein EYQ35_04150 [candidate division UBP10 bacterium]|nr:hypothetical protein [Candidatus Binatota bacterium]
MGTGASRMIRALALMLLLGAGLAAFCHDLHPVALATGPDILLVTIDTLRADHCSAYGYAIETTPFLSDLAHEGVLYEQAWAPSATTAPSHAALFASRWPRSMGVMKNGQPVPGGELMLAELMSKGGYATAAFVSSLPVSSQFGFGQGFDYFDDDFNAEGSSRDKRKAQGHGRKYTHRLDRRADATARHFENWLRQRDDPRPLFAWLHFVDPHYPYGSDRLLDLEWPDSVGVSIRAYDSEILRADRGLETVVNAFRRHSAALSPGGETSDRGSVVLVTSDHGEGLGDHGWSFHGINVYEEAVRVPLVLWGSPGIDIGDTVTGDTVTGDTVPGQVRSQPVTLLDVAPTLTGLAGLDRAPSFLGRELTGPLPEDHAVFLQRRNYRSRRVRGREVRGTLTAVVAQGHKYLVTVSGEQSSTAELYHLADDPGELDDLSASRPGLSLGLARLLSGWESEYPAVKTVRVSDREVIKALRSLGYVE